LTTSSLFLNGGPMIFTGKANPELATLICEYLEMNLGRAEFFKFNNDNTFIRILDNVRQRDVFIVQPTTYPVNDNIMEMLIFIDAARRASAGRITAVMPYYSYARTDKKDQPRVPITGRLVADLVKTAGADRVVLVDLHAAQVQGFFSTVVDELTALPLLADYFLSKGLDDLVIVAPDIGSSRRSRDFATRVNAPLAIIEKRRLGNNDRVETLNVIGNVDGKYAILFDDEINTGGTMVSAANILAEQGSKGVYACATHGILPGAAAQILTAVPNLNEIVITDTVPLEERKKHPKITVVSIAPLLGEAIRRIHEGRSVGELFR
jgi:ribose-phosphate pyrophosphokinase